MRWKQKKKKSDPNSTLYKRHGLKNSILTNYGDDYAFQIAAKDDWTSMAVSLSTNEVKLYSLATGQYLGQCKGHSATINQISFVGPSSPHVLYSCSSDSTIRAWDSRSCQQVSCISTGPSQEIFSFSFGGSSANLLAAGCKSQIIFWDWRTMEQTACLEESHMDDVTQVHFVPSNQSKLVSASVDGLMCLFDTNRNINDDDHLVSVDYFVDCHYSAEVDRLWVIGGTYNGTFGYFPVNYGTTHGIEAAEAIFQSGHTGIVRIVLPMSSIPGRTSKYNGIFGWTGGEDGRLCCWLSDESTDKTCSWISNKLVAKSPTNRRKSRHSPY